MNNPFGQLGELKKMRDQASALDKQMQLIEVEVNKHGVYVRMNAKQEIRELVSNGKSDNDIKGAVNEAVKKSQEVAQKKMMEMMGGMGGLAGLLGGK